MRLQPLNHLIDVVRAVAQPARVCVLGSASLLPDHPDLGSAGAPLELTTDADFLLEPVNEAIAESLQLAAGRDSAFMAQNGYYADILRPTIAQALPAGWESPSMPPAATKPRQQFYMAWAARWACRSITFTRPTTCPSPSPSVLCRFEDGLPA